MNKTVNVLIVVLLIIAVTAVVNIKKSRKADSVAVDVNQPANAEVAATVEEPAPAEKEVSINLTNVINLGQPANAEVAATVEEPAPAEREVAENPPRLVDLGADKCIPCKMMKPILDELRSEYKGIFDVVFIDVWKDPAPGQKAGIRVIPTQIFYDASGKELFRHEGFYSKEDILSKWKELGLDMTQTE